VSTEADTGQDGLRFYLLGPLEVRAGGRPVPLGSSGMRGVLALLLLEPNRTVPLDRIVDVLWAHEPPATARRVVHGYVSRLRRRLGEVDDSGNVRIETVPPGYRLTLDESLIDVTIVRNLLAEATVLPASQRPSRLRAALDVWRGREFADLGGGFLAPQLSELRLAVLEAWFDTELEHGRHDEIIGELARLVDEYPLRERLVAQLVLARYRSGQESAALATYQRFAQHLADDLGIEPGPGLLELYQRILRADPTLWAAEHPTFPVSIYLSDEAGHEQVEAAVVAVLEVAGAPVVQRDDAIIGSWFRRLRADPGVRELGAMAAHAADARLVLAQDAQITATMLQHLGPLITSLQTTKDAVVRLGAVLVVKLDDQLVVHQLTARQQLRLDHQPHLALSPRDILAVLEIGTGGTAP
jgi:DNA-binding SARP family transcriptional activator